MVNLIAAHKKSTSKSKKKSREKRGAAEPHLQMFHYVIKVSLLTFQLNKIRNGTGASMLGFVYLCGLFLIPCKNAQYHTSVLTDTVSYGSHKIKHLYSLISSHHYIKLK